MTVVSTHWPLISNHLVALTLGALTAWVMNYSSTRFLVFRRAASVLGDSRREIIEIRRTNQFGEPPFSSVTLTCSPVTDLAGQDEPTPPAGIGVQKLNGAPKGLDCFKQSLSPLTDQ